MIDIATPENSGSIFEFADPDAKFQNCTQNCLHIFYRNKISAILFYFCLHLVALPGQFTSWKCE